jgi:hypothetical protein
MRNFPAEGKCVLFEHQHAVSLRATLRVEKHLAARLEVQEHSVASPVILWLADKAMQADARALGRDCCGGPCGLLGARHVARRP